MSEIVKIFKTFHFKNKTAREPMVHFKGQDFELIQTAHNQTNLFQDPEFPADFNSLYGFGSALSKKDIIWKRPTVNYYSISKISKNLKFLFLRF